MDSTQRTHHSFDQNRWDAALLEAAKWGDEVAFRTAMDAGADASVVASGGLTVLTCALTGGCWQKVASLPTSFFMSESRLNIIRALVSEKSMSLYALNAPQDALNGVTPLGMAAWLNMPEAVQVLLDASAGAILVDATDAHGATPLMYAARDGNLEVVQLLLARGARPDFRDVHHRTSFQHALAHPDALWLCEDYLRRHRANEAQKKHRYPLTPPASPSCPHHFTPSRLSPNRDISSFTTSLIEAVLSSNLSQIHSLLTPSSCCSLTSPLDSDRHSLLVNLPDSRGWSPIHHAVAVKQPSVEIIDALYLAGADMSLFTACEKWTPLHCLAIHHTAAILDDHGSDQALLLYSLVLHLVRDLRCPLDAKDQDDETPLHIASEHGESIDVLLAFLDLDKRESVRKMRNSRGLTALDVAQAHFKAAFRYDFELPRPMVRAGQIKKQVSASSLSTENAASPEARPPSRPALCSEDTEDDTFQLTQGVLENLRWVSCNILEEPEAHEVDDILGVLHDTRRRGNEVLSRLQARVTATSKELQDTRSIYENVDNLLDRTTRKVEHKSRCKRRWTSEPEGSVATPGQEGLSRAITYEQSSRSKLSLHIPDGPAPRARNRAASLPVNNGKKPPFLTIDSVLANTSDLSSKFSDDGTEVGEMSSKPPRPSQFTELFLPGASSSRISHGVTKLKTWFNHSVKRHTRPELKLIQEKDMERCLQEKLSSECENAVLHDAHRVLTMSGRDMFCISQSIKEADNFVALAQQFVSQGERTLNRAIESREALLRSISSSHRLSPIPDEDQDTHEAAGGGTPRSSTVTFSGSTLLTAVGPSSSIALAQLQSQQSNVSLASTLAEGEDEDVRALRRLLVRKVDARLDGAFDEIEKVCTWLRIVKDVMHDVKKRTATPMFVR